MGLKKNCTFWKEDPVRKENEMRVGESERWATDYDSQKSEAANTKAEATKNESNKLWSSWTESYS